VDLPVATGPAVPIRPAAAAGWFYPEDPTALRALIRQCLAGVPREGRRCRAAIVPHAGLEYSGRCAGQVFGRQAFPALVVIVAPNHTGRVGFEGGASLWPRGAFATPSGNVGVAEDLADRLQARCPLVGSDPEAHWTEHGIEVTLPFLVELAPAAGIVPLVLAWADWTRCVELAAAVADLVVAADQDVLLLASSDMNHHESAAETTRKDRLALAAVERLDARELLDTCRRERVTMCGRGPAAVVIEAARRLGASRAEVVDYRNSGLVTGDERRVVGYAGVLIE